MSSPTYQYLAGLQESTGEIIYSRALHDYVATSDGKGFIDGGQLGPYTRHGGVKLIVIELPLSYGAAYDDWDSGNDKLGIISPKEAKKVRIVPEEERIDRSSEEFNQYKLWGTYGKDGKGPKRHKSLIECDTDHLVAILTTQSHIGPEYKKAIRQILEDRGEKFA